MKRIWGFVLCLFGAAAVILWGILWSLEYVGTDPELYRKLQFGARSDILEYAGVSEEDLIRVNEALADCLRGDKNALEGLEAVVFGEIQPAFNGRELAHMEDCRELFELARTVKNAAKVLGICAFVSGFVLLGNRRRIILASCLGPLLLIFPLGLLAAWAMTDFNAAFNFFHEMLFTNDLWLLDPRTDLLIRICPQRMFMNMGLHIGIMSLVWTVLVPAGTAAVAMLLSKRKMINNGDVK